MSHTSYAIRHLLLDDVSLALQRLAVALDAVQLSLRQGHFYNSLIRRKGLNVRNSKKIQRSMLKNDSSVQNSISTYLQRRTILVNSRQLGRVAVHLRLHRTSAPPQTWQRTVKTEHAFFLITTRFQCGK